MRYDGSIRIHVKGTSHRALVPQAVIEDLTAEAWQSSSVSGTLPASPADGPVEVLVELMDGDHAGWTGNGVITTEEGVVKLEGVAPFTPPV
jgi:hypothetical protein